MCGSYTNAQWNTFLFRHSAWCVSCCLAEMWWLMSCCSHITSHKYKLPTGKYHGDLKEVKSGDSFPPGRVFRCARKKLTTNSIIFQKIKSVLWVTFQWKWWKRRPQSWPLQLKENGLQSWRSTRTSSPVFSWALKQWSNLVTHISLPVTSLPH